MHQPTNLRPTFLTAPDGGLPGIPGSGPTGGGLPGIPGAGPAQTPPLQQPAPAGGPTPSATPSFAQAEPAAFTGAPVTFELASWGSRFGAWLLDGIIMMVILFPLIGIASALGMDTGSSSGSSGSFEFSSENGQFLIVMLLWLLVILLYLPTTMTAMQGSTPAKRMLGIRVVRADGAPITFGFAVKRELVFKGIVVGIANAVTLGLAGLINYLWPLWDSENRALHDMAAKSRVVRR